VTNKIGSGGIENRPSQVSPDRGVKPATQSPPGVAAKEPSAPQSGGVHITESARQLAALEQAVQASPDVDVQRVESVSSAIRDGRYQVSAERIADKLIRMEHDLLLAS